MKYGKWSLYVNGRNIAEEIYEEDQLIEKVLLDKELAEKLQFKQFYPDDKNGNLEEEVKLEDALNNHHRSSRVIQTENSDFGLKTLSLIENFENLNSINLNVFEKNSFLSI